MALKYWDSGLLTPISVPAPGSGDPDWFEVTVVASSNNAVAVVSAGVDFVWGSSTVDHGQLLRSAPIEFGNGEIGWQFIFRRPASGSYPVRLHAVLEDGNNGN